jgi:hypothetical protein
MACHLLQYLLAIARARYRILLNTKFECQQTVYDIPPKTDTVGLDEAIVGRFFDVRRKRCGSFLLLPTGFTNLVVVAVCREICGTE